MKNLIILFFLAFLMTGCKSTRIGATNDLQVRFLDDYTIPAELEVEGTKVGGISGLDYHDGNYYLVSDHPGNPRLYKTDITIDGEKIDSISFTEVIELQTSGSTLEEAHLDLEGILYDTKTEQFTLSSEGSIKKGKDPMVFKVSKRGKFIDSFAVPHNLLAASLKKPRNNRTFEGLAEAFDKDGIWVAMEQPLATDGPRPKLYSTKSPVRITHFDEATGEPTRQFPYRLEPIAKIPWLYFALNGVTDLLEYAPDKFLVVERGFVAGHGSKGYTIRIFDVDASLATNTLELNNLKVSFYNPAKKKLLYDFKWAKKFLSQEIIDNIEGISFGPTLANGNRSLILVSDNNFNSIGKQLNQVILMELIQKQ